MKIRCKKCNRVIAKVEYGVGEIFCKNCKTFNEYKIYLNDLQKIYNMVQYNK